MDPTTIAMGLAQFVPQLAKWITGSDKAEQVAQKAIDIARSVTGAQTGEDALEAIKANPDMVLQYRTAVLAQEVEMRKLGIEETKVFVDDTQDARDKFSQNDRVFYLGVVVLVAFASLSAFSLVGCYQLLTKGLNGVDAGTVAAVATFVGTVIGYMAANAQQVISFFFGSSQGSKDKSDAMAQAVKGLGATGKGA